MALNVNNVVKCVVLVQVHSFSLLFHISNVKEPVANI